MGMVGAWFCTYVFPIQGLIEFLKLFGRIFWSQKQQQKQQAAHRVLHLFVTLLFEITFQTIFFSFAWRIASVFIANVAKRKSRRRIKCCSAASWKRIFKLTMNHLVNKSKLTVIVIVVNKNRRWFLIGNSMTSEGENLGTNGLARHIIEVNHNNRVAFLRFDSLRKNFSLL